MIGVVQRLPSGEMEFHVVRNLAEAREVYGGTQSWAATPDPNAPAGLCMVRLWTRLEDEEMKLPMVGQGAQVRYGSKLAATLRQALRGGMSVDEIAETLGRDSKKIVLDLNLLRKKHGVAWLVNSAGKIEVSLPLGFTQESIFTEPMAPRVRGEGGGRGPQKRTQEMYDAAARGEYPEKPVITSASNMHRQKNLDKIEAWAEEGDWESIEALQQNGIDTYSKMIRRYQECMLMAHRFHLNQKHGDSEQYGGDDTREATFYGAA